MHTSAMYIILHMVQIPNEGGHQEDTKFRQSPQSLAYRLHGKGNMPS